MRGRFCKCYPKLGLSFCSYFWKEQCYRIHYLCARGMAFLCWYGSPELDWRFYFQLIICYTTYWFICFTLDRLILVLWSGSGHAVQFDQDVWYLRLVRGCCCLVHVEAFCVVNLFVCNFINTAVHNCYQVSQSVHHLIQQGLKFVDPSFVFLHHCLPFWGISSSGVFV